ncbi:hypothetical protein [Priestia megaterium]|uniref:Uncharacterized protein n=1 Tax=Priestia megaterium TaxID=1404 RepID=A0A6M6E798_PRIMG|nr:hypothetical protein [Priestia megaterium]QJX80408.1 hypothetical protein FDZ14_30440 [Priestia megaterium]
MIDVEKIEWEKVSGLNIGMFRFDNVCGLPVVWNSETKSVDVLVNGKVLLSYKRNQVTGVVYN